MKRITIVSIVVGLLMTVQYASAQFSFVGGNVNNGTFEQAVFGCYANSTCTIVGFGSPSWSSPSLPATLTNGQSVTWGYPDGSTGSLGGKTSDQSFSLANVAFRNVIRGANQNGGQTSSLQCTTKANVATVHCVIWGPFLDQFGVHGARNFRWEIHGLYNMNDWVLASGNGEADVTVSAAAAYGFLWCIVTPTDANENGSVIVNWDM